MNRTALSRKWYFDKLTAMLDEIAILISSPARYLDAARTVKPTSGIELYERYHTLVNRFIEEFPEYAQYLSLRRYQAAEDGSLRRSDLISLQKDLEAFLIVGKVYNR